MGSWTQIPMWTGSSHAINKQLDTRDVSKNSTQSWCRCTQRQHQAPQVSCPVPQNGPPVQTPITCPDVLPVLLTDRLPSSGVMNLPEQFTEARTTPDVPAYLFLLQRTELRNQWMEEMHRARYGERAWSSHTFAECTIFPNLYMFTSLETLGILSFWAFVEASHYTAIIFFFNLNSIYVSASAAHIFKFNLANV